MRGYRLNLRVLPEEFVANLADAICQVFLDHGFEGSADDLKSDLKKAFQEVIEKRSQLIIPVSSSSPSTEAN